MKGLKIGNIAVAVPIIQGGMGVGISFQDLPPQLQMKVELELSQCRAWSV
jgi:hypothetical protein